MLVLLGASAGVLILVGVSWALGQWRTAPLAEAAARERLALDEPDFAPVDWLFDETAGRALARDAGGDIALLFVLGDRLGSRRWRVGEKPVAVDGARLIIRLDEPSLKSVMIQAPDGDAAALWARQLQGDGAKLDA